MNDLVLKSVKIFGDYVLGYKNSTVIYGYKNSKVEEYAKKESKKFITTQPKSQKSLLNKKRIIHWQLSDYTPVKKLRVSKSKVKLIKKEGNAPRVKKEEILLCAHMLRG